MINALGSTIDILFFDTFQKLRLSTNNSTWSTRQNVLMACESRKPNSREEKFTTMEAQGKIWSRHVSLGNSTRMKRNLPQKRHKAKYAWGAWVGKILTSVRRNPLWQRHKSKCVWDVRFEKNSTCMKKNPLQWGHEAKCAYGVWIRKTWLEWGEICYDGGMKQNVLEARESIKPNMYE